LKLISSDKSGGQRCSKPVETWAVLLTSIGFIVFVTGIVLVIIGIILASVRRSSEDRERDDEEDKKKGRRTRGAGVVLIGPIPIVFGTDRGALLIALATVVAIMIFYIVVLTNS
jgi:uncharacterized protein (TIGR00304 family)